MIDFFCVCCKSFTLDNAKFRMPSRDSNHVGERTENLSCVRENSEKGYLSVKGRLRCA